MKRFTAAVVGSFAATCLGSVPAAWAACNLIPGTEKTFAATLGALNRPYAAPNELIEVKRRPCDAPPAFSNDIGDYVVTVVFTPTSGASNAVVLTPAANCSALASQLADCGTQISGSVTCVADADAAMALVTRDDGARLQFRFPDTDAMLGAANDDLTLAGPAAIAVSAAAAPLPCNLATQPCVQQSGLTACVDRLFANDGTCNSGVPQGTFNHFIALPQPNDFKDACFADPAVCDGNAGGFRLIDDGNGNVLIPMDWRGILVRQNGVPVPRLVRATIYTPVPLTLPGDSFAQSFTSEGGLLPPIFTPLVDPNAPAGALTLFGSADAAYTILRLTRRSSIFRECHAGGHDGLPCNSDADCPAGSCGATVCQSGPKAGKTCRSDANCAGAECGPSVFFAPNFGVGPIVIDKTPGPGVCQVNGTAAACSVNADCTMACSADPACMSPACVQFALEAQGPIPLEGLTQSNDLFAFVANEAIDSVDHDGDGDATDSVVTLRSRQTGLSQALGAPAGCGFSTTPAGRAVVRMSFPPFSFPAVSTEGDVLGFLESERGAMACDQNGDSDLSDGFVRVFKLGQLAEVTSGARSAEAAPLIDSQAVVASKRKVFYRHSESGQALRFTERVSLTDADGEADLYAGFTAAVSPDGRFVAFASDATNMVPGDGNAVGDVFVRDRTTGGTARMSVDSDGNEVPTGLGLGFYGDIAMTPDGRYVAFISYAPDLAPGGTLSEANVFLHDRDSDGNGLFDEMGGILTERISVPSAGGEGDGPSGEFYRIGISANGRFVTFASAAANLVDQDTNGTYDVFVRDRGRLDSNGMFTPGIGTTERVSLLRGKYEASGASIDPSISADGRYVAFTSNASNLVVGETSFFPGIYRVDRCELDGSPIKTCHAAAQRVSLGPSDVQPNGASSVASMSADGRFIAFQSVATNLIPGGAPPNQVYVRDMVLGDTTIASVASDGTVGNAASFNAVVSGDGRYVTFLSDASNLVEDDANGVTDVFVRDRYAQVTERVSVTSSGADGGGATSFDTAHPGISSDGRFIAFASDSPTMNAPVPDGNAQRDMFLREAKPADLGSDATGDGDLNDTVIEAVDADTAVTASLCPATSASVAVGTAAFLRPEAAGSTPSLASCPNGAPVGGGVDLNADGDAGDEVVHYWPGSGPVVNLGLAATAVSLTAQCFGGTQATEVCASDADCPGGGTCTPTWLAAIKADTHANTSEVHPIVVVHRVSAAPDDWISTGKFGSAVQASGRLIVFKAAKAAGANSQFLFVYDADAATLNKVGSTAEDFVVGSKRASCAKSQLIAFHVRESRIGKDLNGDEDTDDDVLRVYAQGLGILETGQAVTPCRLLACEPRQPYRVLGDRVKFLTREGKQNQDLNGDGDFNDLILQQLDVCTQALTVVGVVDEDTGDVGDPMEEPADGGQSTVFRSGRCMLPAGGPLCITDADCGGDHVCVSNACLEPQLVPASCSDSNECAGGASCEGDFVVAGQIEVATRLVHDSVLLPRRSLSFAVTPPTVLSRDIKVKVRNADVSPVAEVSGHAIQLIATDGTCPVGTVVGLPDFNNDVAGDQDSVNVAGGKLATAVVHVQIDPASFASFNDSAPYRCTLSLSAGNPVPNSVDPTPRNNDLGLEIEVVRAGDAGTTLHESSVLSPKPLKLGIRGASTTKDIGVKVRNGDVVPLAETPGHMITLSVADGDCPSGTVTLPGATSALVAGGETAEITTHVSITAAGFLSPSKRSPARCTAVLQASGPGLDPEASNNTTRLVIDVIDKSDF